MLSLRERAPERWNGNQGGAFFYNSFYSFAAIQSNLNRCLVTGSGQSKIDYKSAPPFWHPPCNIVSPPSLLPCPLNTTLYENLETCLTSLMSDIEKLENPQRRCQVGNPAPLYVAFHWHGYWQNSSAVQWTVCFCIDDARPLPLQRTCASRYCSKRRRRHGPILWWSGTVPCWHVGVCRR